MSGLKKILSVVATLAISASSLLASSTPASAYASGATLGSGASSNTITTPTGPVTPSISGGQPFAFSYPGGVFEVGAASSGSSTLKINAYKNGALDTSFNSTGSASFTSQLVTGDRSFLTMTTYASGTKWAILDSNGFTNSGYNFLYLGTFSGGYQSTITLPTTASNYTTCTNKLNGVSNGTYTSYSGSFELVPDTGFAAPLLMITCQAFVNTNTASYTSKANFLVNYSGGTTIGTPASLTSFGGSASAGPVNLLNSSTRKTITNFGVSVNPDATGSQVALTFFDAVTDGTSYSNSTIYDTTNYTDYVVTRVTAAGVISQTTSAWTGQLAGTRSGRLIVPPRNSGTVYALQHATDGTNLVAKVLTFGSSGAASSQTAVTGASMLAGFTRAAPSMAPGSTLKFASVNNGSSSYFVEIDTSTAVASLRATFTPNGGFSHADLLWAMADNSNGLDFYGRTSSTQVLRVFASSAPVAPTAPATPTVVRGDGSVAVTWVAPANGGAAITGYSLDYSSNSGTNWTNWSNTLAAGATSETVTGLTNGTAYVFRVAATNSIGTSAWSSSSASASPAALPSAPTLLTLTPGANNVALTWAAPSNTGGFAVTDYTIEYSSNGGTNWSTFAHSASTATSITVTGLTNGTSYVFRVKAVTSIGTGSASATSAAQLVAAAPGQLNVPTISNGNSQATVSWVAPADNGCAITAYRVDYSSNSGSTWNTFTSSATGTSVVVTGLTNGTSYVFRVAATNCMGFGAASAASASVTPNQTPTAATGLTVVGAGSSTVTLTWGAVSASPAVTDYRVEYSTDGGATWTTYADGVSTSSSASLTGLTTGLSYSFRVSAINSIGVGVATGASTAVVAGTVPATIAAAPTVTASPGSVLVIWGVPANGGSALTTAELQYSTNGGGSWTTYSGTVDLTGAITVTGLTGGQAYVFRARTNNFFGSSAWSSASASVTALAATAPSVVTGLTSTPGSSAGSIDLTWNAPASNGSPITDYLVEYSSDGGVTWQTFTHPASSATSITVTGLAAGTQYQFRVKAVNAVGNATASAGSSPIAAPAAVTSSAAEITSFIGSLKPGGTVNLTDGKLTIAGENMDKVSKVLMNAVDAPIVFRTSLALTVQIPATVIGWVDVEFITAGSNIRFQNFVYVNNNKNQIAKLGLGYVSAKTSQTSKANVSTSIFKDNSVVRLAKQTPNFSLAKSVTCVGYVGKGMSQREALARARHTCEQLTLRYPSLTVQLAISKTSLRAHVVALFKY